MGMDIAALVSGYTKKNKKYLISKYNRQYTNMSFSNITVLYKRHVQGTYFPWKGIYKR